MKKQQKFKFINNIKELGPRLKWILFSEMQDYKINSKYIDMICPEPDNKSQKSQSDMLEEMVKQTLIKEFSPEIQKMKSYNLLVDAVVHNLKKKSLEE